MKRWVMSWLVGLILCGASIEAGAVSMVVDVDPSTAGVQNTRMILAGELFDVDVVVEGLTVLPLQGFNFSLMFDGAILNALDVIDGGFLTAPVLTTTKVLGGMTVEFNEITLGLGTAIGAGTLATINFEALGAGLSSLTLSNVGLTGITPFFSFPPIPVDQVSNGDVDVSAGPVVPEPGTLLLLTTGLGGIWLGRRILGMKKG